MNCIASMDVGDDFFHRFRSRVAKDRIPLSGSLELTTRCNFSCVHCYLPKDARKKQRDEIDTDWALSIIDDLAEAGCLYLLLTGGEALLRSDFQDIYTHARRRGLLVAVFTNGSTVTGEHIHLFREYPPIQVEVSVYGASPGTYERVTGSAGAYERTMSGIKRLHESGVRVHLKTVLMDRNVHELDAMETLARSLGVRFRFDASIMPRLDGDMAPLAYRLSPETAVDCEFRDPARAGDWARFWSKMPETELGPFLYICGAGKTCFHITADGLLQPCLMTTSIQADLKHLDFNTAWDQTGAAVARVETGTDHPCRACERIVLCGYCPPFSTLETGSDNHKTDYLCRIGQLRHERIMKLGVSHGGK